MLRAINLIINFKKLEEARNSIAKHRIFNVKKIPKLKK